MIRYYRVLLFLVWTLSVVCYGLGLYLPILATKSKILGLTFNSKEVRLFDSIVIFFNNNEYFLAIIIVLFTIVVPVLKYLELFYTIVCKQTVSHWISYWGHQMDKWSMIDVFIVAVLILNFKMNSTIIVMKLMPGITFLAVSIVLRMFVLHLIVEKRVLINAIVFILKKLKL